MALVTTLLLLSLMVAMTLAMVIAVTSDSLITRYYRNFRASFYAADSGLNVARQYMLDQLEANIATGSIAPNTAPLQNLPGALSSITSSVYDSLRSYRGHLEPQPQRRAGCRLLARQFPGHQRHPRLGSSQRLLQLLYKGEHNEQRKLFFPFRESNGVLLHRPLHPHSGGAIPGQ